MTLTVPRSNRRPGRAARPGPMVVDETAGAVADFGQTMLAVGTAVETDRLDREMQRLQVDMTRDLNDLRLQTEQIGDPDAAEGAWTSGVEQIRDSYALPGEDGRPRLDPKNAERFGIAFDSLANRHAFSLGRRTLELRNAQRQANYLSYAHAATQAYATGDDQLREGTLADLDAMIDADVAAGRIDAAEGQKRKMAFRADGDNARAIHMISSDPAGFQEARERGEFTGISADTLARYDVQAKSALERQQAEAAKAEEKAIEARDKAIGQRLDEIGGIADDGRVAVDETFLADPAVKAHPKYAETKAKIALREEGFEVAQLTPAQLRAQIETERKRKVTHEWETARLQVLQDALAAHETGYSKDPVAYARSVNRDVPDLPEFDPANPVEFGQAVQQRVEFGEREQFRGFTNAPRYFSNEEREELRQLASAETDPETRAALAGQLAMSLSGASPDTIEAFGFDPVFVQMGELQAATGNTRLTAEISRGQQAIASKTVVMPSQKDRQEPVVDHLERVYSGQSDGAARQQRIVAAADALYAARVQGQDASGDIQTDVYRQALHEVMGGVGSYDSNEALGGIQDVNGVLTPLPVGIGRKDISTAIMQLRRDLTGVRSPAYPDAMEKSRIIAGGTGMTVRPITYLTSAEAQARADAILQGASVTGGSPGINGEPLDASELGDYELLPAGGDTYALAVNGVPVMDLASGNLWRFDLRKLVGEYGQ